MPPNPQFYFQQDANVEEDTGQQGHMFQQSVTLTARMWYEGNDTRNSGGGSAWRWASWRVPTEYLPLLVGLCCGIAIVLLALSALVVWRCCIFPKRKHEYCDGLFCEVSSQTGIESSKAPRDTAVYAMRNGPWGYHSRVLGSNDSLYAVPRSQTINSMPSHSCSVHNPTGYRKTQRPISQAVTKELTMIIPPPSSTEFLVPSSSSYHREISPTNSLINGLDDPITYENLSKSTPALEDLYAKVNFSKKRKNRMCKDDAAVIALSKSRTELDCDALAIPSSSAVVVYNERTAL